jgi:opacity protein-like surface antigen
MQKLLITAGLLVALAGAVPSRADAQTFVTPFAGVTFNGDAPANKLTYGGALTFMGKAAGFELDFGYTPDFYNQQTAVALVADSHVATAMASVVIGVGDGPVRPYGVVGLGLIRSRIGATDFFSDVSTNDLGVNAGVGVHGKLTDHVFLRGDLRYFRSLQDPSDNGNLDVVLGNFDFWRATVGISFKL